MKFAIVIYPDAEDELHELMFYLNRQQPGLGDRFLDDYEKTLKFLEQFAEAIPKSYGHFRHAPIGNFSIILVYRINRKTVQVRKVIHLARHEKRRYKR